MPHLQLSHDELDDAAQPQLLLLVAPWVGSAVAPGATAERQSTRTPTYSDLLAAQPGEETCNRTVTDI